MIKWNPLYYFNLHSLIALRQNFRLFQIEINCRRLYPFPIKALVFTCLQYKYFETRGPRWPWIAHLIFWDCSCQFFFFVAFREEFTRISLCLYSARSLHSLIPCLLNDQNFKKNSEKGHSRKISMRLFQNLTNSFRKDFSWFCLCSYSQVAPIHQSLVHGQIKISLIFLREVTLETFQWIGNKRPLTLLCL